MSATCCYGWLVVQVQPDLYRRDWRTFTVMLAVSVLAATVSWYLIERPLSRLKDVFPTTRAALRGELRGRVA